MATFPTINIGAVANDGAGDPLRTAFGKINDVIAAINAAGGIGPGGIGAGDAVVKAATTTNITLSGAQTIDGVSCVAADRVLVKNQSAPAENGVYIVAAGAWSRASDFNAWDELVGRTVAVEQGSTQADTAWQCAADSGGSLGTTAISFVQTSSGTINATRWGYLAAATAFGGGLLALADAAALRAAQNAGGTVTASTPLFAFTQTWNNAGVVFKGLTLDITDTASAVNSKYFEISLSGGTYPLFELLKTAGSTQLNLRMSNGTIRHALGSSGGNSYLQLLNSSGVGAFLTDEGAHLLALRNGVNAQAFRIYNTFTDASNYERGELRWNANNLELVAGLAGTGVTRALRFGVNNSAQWQISTNGHFQAISDNTYDIGASGANRPRDIYGGGSLNMGTNITAGGTVMANGNAAFLGGVGLQAASSTAFGFSSTTSSNGAADTTLYRDGAADTIAQRRGANAQAWRIYNTHTDASNYERAKIAWSTNVLQIGTEKLGTGVARDLVLQTDGTTRFTITGAGTVSAAGYIYGYGGATGAGFLSSAGVGSNGRAELIWTSTTAAYFSNTILGLGGITSSFPALKRNAAALEVKLADDSGYATLVASNLQMAGASNYLTWAGTSFLYQDASNAIAQRNGVNAQTFRIYNTYTDASNYARVSAHFSAGDFFLRTEQLGTGSAAPMYIGTEGAVNLTFRSNATNRWTLNSSGHFVAAADNTYDIGASTATRPRNAFLAGYLSIGDGVTAPGATTGEAKLYVDTADGDLKVKFADGTTKVIVTDAPAKEQIWVDASAMKPRTSNGCAALATIETATNKVNVETLDFDAASIEYAWFRLRIPKRFGTSTFKATFHWSHPSTATNFGVVWGIQAQAFGDNEALDAAWGTAGEVTDTGGTTDREYQSPQTAAVTIANLGAQELVYFQVYRKATDAADTLAVDARLEGLMLEFDVSQPSDD